MSFGSALIHALSLVAPALGVALVLGLATAFGAFGRRHAGLQWVRRRGLRDLAVVAGIGALVLLASVWWLGRDGKMLAYGLLVMTTAVTQGLLLKVWQR